VQPSTNHHSEWLLDAERTGLFACDSSCGPYHLLAPLLHSVKHFLSYEHYPELIRAVLANAGPGPIRVLLAGAESEESVAAFLRASHGLVDRLDVLDRCATPLRRISANREASDPAIGCIHGDILLNRFDLTYQVAVADSFLKQFPMTEKRNVLASLRAAVDPGGWLLLREYTGDLSALLGEFWPRLIERLRQAGWQTVASQDAQGELIRVMPALESWMRSKGVAYEAQDQLISDIEASGLTVEFVNRAEGADFLIVGCRRPV